MIRLVYTSTAAAPFSQDDLVALLRTSSTNNARLAVTGVLLYQHERFFQVLEGAEEAVRPLYARIAADPRHRAVRLILEEPAAERMFEQWSMGFVASEALAPADQEIFTALLRESRGADALLPQPSIVRLLLKTFRSAPIR